MKRTTFLTMLAIALGITLTSATKKVHTIGDSTMANYNTSTEVKRGWGMYMQQFLDGVEAVNYARGGRDTRIFYNDHWTAVKNAIQPGDYVIIQFAHNDEKINGVDREELYNYYMTHNQEDKAKALDTRGTTPSTTYRAYLEKFIDETRELGGIPILASPVCRCYFSGNIIKRNGKHDLGDNYQVLTENGLANGPKLAADDHTMDYPYHMQQVAIEKDVPFIDLTKATEELYLSYGSAKCHDALFCPGDNTHFNTAGATLVARLAAQLMKEQGIMTENIVIPAELSVSPTAANLGEGYVGQEMMQEFSLSGFGLSPEDGNINITTTNAIELSTDKKTWGSSLTLQYSAGTIIETFYARVILDGGDVNGTVTITQGEQIIEVPFTASTAATIGGADVKATWALTENSSCSLTGPAIVVEESLVGMTHKQFSSGFTWPEGSGYTTSRNAQLVEIEGSSWPAGEIDESPARYVEFGLTATKGMQLNINKISLYVGAWGGNMMKCHVKYSTSDDFGNPVTMLASDRMTNKTTYAVSATPVIKLKEGETVRLRIYPWIDNNSSTATGKYLAVGDVNIEGVAFDPTGIEKNFTATVQPSKYYDLNGRMITKPSKGIVIQQMSNGEVKKVVVK